MRPEEAPALGPLLDNGVYLTELASYVPRPDVLTEDFRFAPAGADTPYRRVVYRDELAPCWEFRPRRQGRRSLWRVA